MIKYLFIALFGAVTLHIYSAGLIVVDPSGAGDYTSIQSAINSVPANNSTWRTILIKKGIYDEHVMINNHYIALVGESRSHSRIEHNLARSAWNKGAGGGSNIGCGVINIAADCHDIVIADLTVRNLYEGAEDYTEVIRSETGSTKIWVLNSSLLCLWKDTFALWGKANGMYYSADCTYRGSIDAVCPRGWCYIINGRFVETRSSSPIWHEGIAGLDQKLVVQSSFFHAETNKNIKLQNHQGAACFYYLDCLMSDSIVQQGSSATTYYYGNQGRSDIVFYKNNISREARQPINAAWTFGHRWSPEDDMPAVLAYASLPQPYHNSYDRQEGASILKWSPARDAVSYQLYLGQSKEPPLVATTEYNSYQSTLDRAKVYYWRVNTINSLGETIEGRLWRFSTEGLDPIAPDPDPEDPEQPTDRPIGTKNIIVNAISQFTINAGATSSVWGPFSISKGDQAVFDMQAVGSSLASCIVEFSRDNMSWAQVGSPAQNGSTSWVNGKVVDLSSPSAPWGDAIYIRLKNNSTKNVNLKNLQISAYTYDPDNIENAIASPQSDKTIVGQQFYNTTGQPTTSCHTGILLVKSIYSDGSVVVQKQINRLEQR